MNKNYPSFKVFFWFSMCPFFSGLFLFLSADFYHYFVYGSPTLIHKSGLIGLWIYVVFGIFGLIFFFIPGCFLAALYVYLKLYKLFKSYFLVFFLGGVVAHVWSYILVSMVGKADIKLHESFGLNDSNNFILFLLGAFSSLIVAYFVLPKKYLRLARPDGFIDS